MSYKINYTVYKITNLITNQCYIGVDSYFPKRLRQHKSCLLRNVHKNKYLQYSYNKYKEENFKFEKLIECNSREEMLNKEIEFISIFKSLEKGYNHTIGGEGSFGYKHSEESISKMSSWKRVITQEWRDAISKGTKGIKKKEGIKRVNHPDYKKWLGGEKHPVAKYSWKDIHLIRLKYLEGYKQRDLAKEFKTSNTYINYIIKGNSWIDKNYFYIKKNNEQINNLKKYLYEVLQAC